MTSFNGQIQHIAGHHHQLVDSSDGLLLLNNRIEWVGGNYTGGLNHSQGETYILVGKFIIKMELLHQSYFAQYHNTLWKKRTSPIYGEHSPIYGNKIRQKKRVNKQVNLYVSNLCPKKIANDKKIAVV